MPQTFLLCAFLFGLCLGGLPTAVAGTQDAGPGTRSVIEAALSKRLAEAAAAGFSGSVLVADGERVLFEKSYGLADPAAGTPVRSATRFNLASAGKLFTTVSIMQLVQQGKLDLDAPVGRYLPDWPVATVREQVTPRQLLMHTSGLGSFWGDAFDARRAGLRGLSDYRPLLATEPDFVPGTAWQYSNSGYLLLGLIVEAVSGQDYYRYVAEQVFKPAGMQDSGYFRMDGVANNVAVPHEGGTGAGHDRTFGMPEPRGAAAGGGYSTPRDLLRFQRALTGGVLLDAKTLDQLFAPVTLPAGTRAPPHGLGIIRYTSGVDVAWGHPGGAPGVGVEFRALRAAGWVVIATSNSDQPRLMPLTDQLCKLIAENGGPDLRLALRGTPVRVSAGKGAGTGVR